MGAGDFIVKVKIAESEINKAIKQVSIYDTKKMLEIENIQKSATKSIIKRAQQRINNKTGNLKKSGKTDYNNRTGTAFARFKAPHAHLVEFGAKATTSTPQNRKVLKMGDRYFKKAKIPARRPRPFLFPAYQETYPEVLRDIKEVLKKP